VALETPTEMESRRLAASAPTDDPCLVDVGRIDHVGVIVDDLDDASRLLGEGFGLERTSSVERDDLRLAFFRCGDVSIEVIEPLDPELRRERLGDGAEARIEHIAFEVSDLERALAALGALGIQPNAPPLRSGARTMFWTEPATSDGIMFQFVATEGG
jgi:methylmalonyl-CoA/ethylmalonyl-CoA epimerase